ncbi:hypothetical protein [Arthrobacter sp. YN]|uniref:hypothetical protein n=1 Tax=Arthrobacter sp. YN TaxID=2020486 RepID=UPI0012FDC01C|nr:hypothetical protein [Arthrobacter sp. YN]
MEQWDLHEYFLCTDRLTEATLRSHCDGIKDTDTSLPQRAGKAYAALMRNMGAAVPTTQLIQPRGTGRKQNVLTVRSIVKPNIDVDHFVDVLMSLGARVGPKD